jgi:bifunctional DNase/RNase
LGVLAVATGGGSRGFFVGAGLFCCAAAGTCCLLLAQDPGAESVELVAQEIVRCANGQAVLVLREKHGDRRLPIPVSSGEAAAIEQRLTGGEALQRDLASVSIRALGGKVVRASIDAVGRDRVFLGHVSIAGSGGAVEVPAGPQDSVPLALDARAPIVAAREVLDAAAISPGELHNLGDLDTARSISRDTQPLPLLKI